MPLPSKETPIRTHSTPDAADSVLRDPDAAAATASSIAAAAAKAAEPVITVLINAHAALDSQDNDGCTALHHAALHDHSKIVATLLAGGADGTVQSNNGVAYNTIA